MAMRFLGGYELGRILAELGMLPPECALVELKMPADGVLQLQFTVNVTIDDLPKLAEAFTKMHTQITDEEKERVRIANIVGDPERYR